MPKLPALSAIALALAAMPLHAQMPFTSEVVAEFDEPWAIEVMPDGRMLVTETKGQLFIVGPDGSKSRAVSNVPDVAYGGQGGLGDVILHPGFSDNGVIYLSYAEAGVPGTDTRGAAVVRAVLDASGSRPSLSDVEVIWRQYPKFLGYGHYGHRMMFDRDGYLWITSGERQKFTPAQDMQSNAGKMIRLKDDGSIPADNPFVGYDKDDAFVDDGGVYSQVWSYGHRNPYGLAQAENGQIWEIEMGPAGGDELNLIERGANYGYPIVSNGEHYDGRPIPDHDTRPEFKAPATWWTPVISPADLLIYGGEAFADWQGDAFIAGLSSKAIIRVELHDDGSAEEVERYDMGVRIRALAENAAGQLLVLEDERGGTGGRLLRLSPAN
jgi:glucose/arabinose dehydrogenase